MTQAEVENPREREPALLECPKRRSFGTRETEVQRMTRNARTLKGELSSKRGNEGESGDPDLDQQRERESERAQENPRVWITGCG
jgi:hypothetical protein